MYEKRQDNLNHHKKIKDFLIRFAGITLFVLCLVGIVYFGLVFIANLIAGYLLSGIVCLVITCFLLCVLSFLVDASF